MKRVGKQIYRVGDLVEIISPEVFLRCDYPYSYADAKDDMKHLFKVDIEEFMEGVYHTLCGTIKSPEFHEMNAIDDDFLNISKERFISGIIKILGYEKVYLEKFGGSERKVITETKEEIKGLQGVVVAKKLKQSGKYNIISNYDNSRKMYIYDKKLENVKRHVILHVACDGYHEPILIEDIHVTKIQEINNIKDDNPCTISNK